MATLLLKFSANLKEDVLSGHHGPIFHRWLPDGEKDAIALNTGDSNTEIRVWFERRGFVDKDFIRYDYKRREVDPKVMSKQAILEAGPLMGLLKILNLSEEELLPLRENKIGDDRYISLGKKVVTELLYPPVARFLNVLRINFGQYWIPELTKWDSRKKLLGEYCRSWKIQWSLDGGNNWTRFIPDMPDENHVDGLFKIPYRDFHEFPTKEDWQEISRAVQEGYDPSPAAFFLARTHQFLEQDNLRYAFVEGVTALELAIEEFSHQKLRKDAESLFKHAKNAFKQLKMKPKVVLVATFLGNIPLRDIEYAVAAVDKRNAIVHDGESPPDTDSARNELYGLLSIIAALLTGPRFRFPFDRPCNAIRSSEGWKQYYNKPR